MFQRKPRRFRHRSIGRGRRRHSNGEGQTRIGPNAFLNDERRNNFRSTQSAEQLFQKYSGLAKEALSSGDKTLSENYFQHADHFLRIIEDKKRHQNQTVTQVNNDKKETNNNSTQNSELSQNQDIEEKKNRTL